VDLPQVEVIGIEPSQRVVEKRKRRVASARMHLRGEEDLLARAGSGFAKR
jgi:hypothetical protein